MRCQIKTNIYLRCVSLFLILTFGSSSLGFTQPAIVKNLASLNLPVPGSFVGPSQSFIPVLLKGMTIYPNEPLRFDFIVESGNANLTSENLKKESNRLVKYFLAAMTVPKDDLWVNLSPYEHDRIIPNELGKTELGRDMLEQDYILKQLTASLMYPEKELGKSFWEKIYKQAKEKFGTTEIPMDTFNKVWIIPESATVYEKGQTVYIVQGHLKVLLDQDYLALEKNANKQSVGIDKNLKNNISDASQISSHLIREIILPEIEKEVNVGNNFSVLRQIYYSLILAKWYKETIKDSLLSKIYVDRKKIVGIQLDDQSIKDRIYEKYMEAYKTGVFNFIKEDYDELSQKVIPRKYFSGGEKFGAIPLKRSKQRNDLDASTVGNNYVLGIQINPQQRNDLAMLSNVVLDIHDSKSSDVDLVGGKAVNLKELSSIPGIKVPRGFNVTTTLFFEYLKSINVYPLINELEELSQKWKSLTENLIEKRQIEESIGKLSRELQDKILKGEFSNQSRADIIQSYKQLSSNGQDALVAVRSSATDEDMSGVSFAGQYSTYLNQQGDDQIIEAIKKVWASTYSLNAINYRNKNGIAHNKTKMAVMILEMINPQSAGTAFSIDLETGLPMISINNTYGLGEVEVAGNVTSDTWIIDPISNSIIKRRIGKKQSKLIYDSQRKENIYVENLKEQQDKFAIGLQKALQIATQLKLIHQHYTTKYPNIKFIDAEYVVTTEGEIIFTQVRPETVWSKGETTLITVDQNKAKNFPIILQGGVTGSVGVVTGIIRIVRSPEQAEAEINPGDILVAPNTTSVWERSMGVAGGMITEIGGPGNHTAVVSRELGKPAIVGSSDAINLLSQYDGQVVTIDGLSKRVYLGKIPEDYLNRSHEIPTQYRGIDDLNEESHWEGALKANQTAVDDDGTRWIGKPNEPTSLFLNRVHEESHRWIADTAGLSPVRGRVKQGVYQVQFSDIHKWREELQKMNLDELEGLLQKWVEIIDRYMNNSRDFTLTNSSVEKWLNSFIELNGIMNIAFPLNEILSGLREEAFTKRGIKEPYLSQARYSTNAQFGETLATESLREYGKLLNQLRWGTTGSSVSLIDALRRVSQEGAYPPELLTQEIHRKFYEELESYAKNYRVTSEFALSFSQRWTLQKIAQELVKDYTIGRKINISQPTSEEFYPEDLEFSRINRLAALSEKLKQDSHHIKFRGQWKIMELLQPFCEFLIMKGEIKEFGEIFDHEPSWLLKMLEKYEKTGELRNIAPAENFSMKPYDLDHAMLGLDPIPIEGSIEKIVTTYREQGVSENVINNLSQAYKNALSIIAHRYSDRREELNQLRINITANTPYSLHAPEGRISMNVQILNNRDRIAQELVRGFESQIIQPKTDIEKKVEALITDVEHVLYFLALNEDQKSKYLGALIKDKDENGRNVFIQVLIRAIESQSEFDSIINKLIRNGYIKESDRQQLQQIYNQRNIEDSVFDLILNYANEAKEYHGLKQVPLLTEEQRFREIGKIFTENLIFLKDLWRNKNPGKGDHDFYRSLMEESQNTGVSSSLIIIGLINLSNQNPVDSFLLKRRWQIDFNSTPVNYVFIGGGGFNSGTIGRGIKWVNEHERSQASEAGVYDSINITSTWDRGGSSQKDADAVRNKYGTHVMSPGDIMTVLSFQSITDKNWFTKEDKESLWGSAFKPEDRDAVMDLLYTYRNRLIVPEGQTLEDIIVARIQDVYNDKKLAKPDNWYEFMINLRSAARVIDHKLLNEGFLQGIRDQRTSVQNLLLMALVMAFDMDVVRASHEIHHILGLKNIFALPASFEDAISGMRLKAPDGTTNDEIVGHLNYANEKDSYLRESESSSYRGRPFSVSLKESENEEPGKIVKDVPPNQFPSANPDAIKAIENTQRALVMGMSSPFDSTLVNLLPKEIIDAVEKKVVSGVPSIYFPKVIEELQIEGLSLREILEIWERSIQHARGDESFKIQNIITHVFMPRVSEELWDRYLDQLKNDKKYLLNEEGQRKLESAKTISAVRDIFFEKKYWSDDTNRKVKEGWIKISKLIPGDRFVFSEDDRQFLKSRRIKIVDIDDDSQNKLYRIWEERVVYNTNEVARILEMVTGKETSDEAMTTSLSSDLIKKMVAVSGDSIRSFLKELVPYIDHPENSPFSDISHLDNLWQEVRKFKENESEFSDEKLIDRKDGIPRIELRGRQKDGSIAQVAVIGVPGEYRKKILSAYGEMIKQNGLSMAPAGLMTVELNRENVNKALPIDFLSRHFDEILEEIGYTAGNLIDARKTRTVIIADGDGTIYGSPTRTTNPTLSESPTREVLVQYLRAGGIIVINSGNELELVVKRLLDQDAIPRDLRNRLLIAANGGASMVRLTAEGEMVEIDKYGLNSIKEKVEQIPNKIIEGLDVIYLGDDATEKGSDFPAFQKVGFQRSVTVSKDERENIPQELRSNYVGGLETGTRVFLEKVVESAKSKPFQKLFNPSDIESLSAASRIPLTTLNTNELLRITNEFSQQIQNRVQNGSKSSLAMEPAFITASSGKESGEYLAVDWGGSNLRVMLVKLIPGQKLEVIKSKELKFTDQHKTGKKDPFQTIAEQIKQLDLDPNQEYRLGFTFSQPVEQENVLVGKLRKWVKGWGIPEVVGKNVSELLQKAIDEDGITNVKVKALVNDVIAAHLVVPNADIGLILGTGFTFSIVDANGQLINTEAGGFYFDDLPQTIYDRNLYQNVDPINDHAFEKMVSGAYIGKLFRMNLKRLRTEGKLFGELKSVPFIDDSDKLQLEEFETEEDLKLFIEAVKLDIKNKLQRNIPEFSTSKEAFEWIINGPFIYQLFDVYKLEKYLTESNLELYQRIKAELNVNNLLSLNDDQVTQLRNGPLGHKFQRIILNLIYDDLMPKDGADVLMSKLISFVEQYDDSIALNEALSNEDQFGLSVASDQDLKTIQQLAKTISKRAGRLLAAALIAAIQQKDQDFSKDHVIAVDGSLYENHPKMRLYIEEGINELRRSYRNDLGGQISFQFVKDSSGMGAAIAAAIATSNDETPIRKDILSFFSDAQIKREFKEIGTNSFMEEFEGSMEEVLNFLGISLKELTNNISIGRYESLIDETGTTYQYEIRLADNRKVTFFVKDPRYIRPNTTVEDEIKLANKAYKINLGPKTELIKVKDKEFIFFLPVKGKCLIELNMTKQIAFAIGEALAILHLNHIIHDDLWFEFLHTTINILILPNIFVDVSDGSNVKVQFIGFGRSYEGNESSTIQERNEVSGAFRYSFGSTFQDEFELGYSTTEQRLKSSLISSKKIKPRDNAMSSDVGGINLNEIPVNRQGDGMNIKFDSGAVAPILETNVDGFSPVIINLTPIKSILPLLGLENNEEKELKVSNIN